MALWQDRQLQWLTCDLDLAYVVQQEVCALQVCEGAASQAVSADKMMQCTAPEHATLRSLSYALQVRTHAWPGCEPY